MLFNDACITSAKFQTVVQNRNRKTTFKVFDSHLDEKDESRQQQKFSEFNQDMIKYCGLPDFVHFAATNKRGEKYTVTVAVFYEG